MLFKKECKKVLFSVTFLIFLVGLFGFFISQFISDTGEVIEPPIKGRDDYGTIVKEDPDILMPAAIDSLLCDYSNNEYIAYPIAFYKEVRLRDAKKDQMADILCELTGMTKEEVNNYKAHAPNSGTVNENGEFVPDETENDDVPVNSTLTYERFKELMKNADKIIGGGSDFSEDDLIGNFSRVPATYEDVIGDYNKFFEEDKVYTAYSRLFCDYLGIPLAILPVFICTALCLKDKKSQMQQLIYTRKISSFRLVITRFLSITAMSLVPVLVTVIIGALHVKSLYPEYNADFGLFFILPAVWLIPAVTFSSALAMLLTEASSTMIAVLIQGVMWFTSVNSGELTGSTKLFTFIIRHNSLAERSVFMDNISVFYTNRIIYLLLSAVLIFVCAAVYELKRRGKFYEFKGFGIHNKNKSQA